MPVAAVTDAVPLSEMTLPDLIRAAWDAGQETDLTGVGYGRIHWGDRQQIRDQPDGYYYFLAGLARLLRAQRAIEIGTHCGGSARAIWRGMADEDHGLIVTVDITQESDEHLAAYPRIKKVVGDANRQEVLRSVASHVGDDPVDILFVDADHTFMPTFLNYSIYSTAFRPRIAVFDDAVRNDSMREAWHFISRSVPAGDAVNAADIVQAIRPQAVNPGFGVVLLRHNF